MKKRSQIGLLLGIVIANFGLNGQTCGFVPGNPIDCCEVPAGYFLPATYDLNCGANLFASADFLYWTAGYFFNQVGVKVVNTPAGATGAATIEQVTSALAHQAQYEPGFKVTMGTDLPGFDHIEMSASYLWYHTSTTSNFFAGTGEQIEPISHLYPYFVPGGLPTGVGLPDATPKSTHLRSQFTVHWDMADITAGRPLYLSKRIILHPFIGLKGFWTTQEYHMTFDGTLTNMTAPGTHISRAKYWGIGPHLGLEAKGLLFWGTYVAANADFLLPYNRQYYSKVILDFPGIINAGGLGGANPTEQKALSHNVLQPIMEAGLGLGWSSYLGSNGYHVDFAATYNFMSTWLYSHAAQLAYLVPNNFYFHGLTVKGQFNF